MSRTYDALRKAEADKAKKEGRSEPADPLESQPPFQVDFELSASVQEQYQRIHTALIASRQRRPQAIVVVGANHGDGVTTVSSLLAKMIANGRSVLLIDANLRTPSLANLLRVRPNGGGFTETLAHKISIDEAISETDTPNLFLMTSGAVNQAAPHLFEAGAFDELLSTLRQRFDYVFFDAAPLGKHLDATFLASRVDGVILVVKAESTRVDVGQEMKRHLDEVGARILGVVVNRTQEYVPQVLRRLLS